MISIPIGSLDAVIALALKSYMDIVMLNSTGPVDLKSPLVISFLIVSFTSIQVFLKYLSAYLNTWVGNKISNGLKLDLFEKILTFETAFF